MTLVLAQQDRGLTREFTIQDAAGGNITPAAGDKLRITIGHAGHLPIVTGKRAAR